MEANTDLASWLLVQIAEDEQLWSAHDEHCSIYTWDARCDCGGRDRWLADCDAKRRVIEAVRRREGGHPGHHANWPAQAVEDHDEYDSCALCIRWNETTLDPYALKLLALPYAHRPGYREQWAP